MKIGILRNPLGIGGAELSLLDIAINLKKMGHDVWMHFDAGDTASMKQFNQHGTLGVRYGAETDFVFKNKNITNEAWAVNQLKDTDVVFVIHRHLYSKRLAQAVNGVPKKLVYAPGKNSHHVYGKYEGIPGHGQLITGIQHIMFNSNYTLQRHRAVNYPKEYKRIFKHVHPPIHLDYYLKREREMDRYEVRRRLGFRSGIFHVGLVGRLIPSKEPLQAIEIAKKFRKLGMPYQFHFIGDGMLGKQVRAKIKAYDLGGHVKVCGMQDDPLEHIVALDAVLHLCKHESLSRAMRESMLMKKPIVAFRGAGNVELLKHVRHNKILFKDNSEVVDILRYLAQNGADRELLGQLSHDEILKMEQNAAKTLGGLIK
jgi:glycosyltransferase involved in cell wall biosynthesis